MLYLLRLIYIVKLAWCGEVGVGEFNISVGDCFQQEETFIFFRNYCIVGHCIVGHCLICYFWSF